jgi:hypothetical protein
VAQDVDQAPGRGDVERVGLAVDLEVDLHAILPGLISSEAGDRGLGHDRTRGATGEAGGPLV